MQGFEKYKKMYFMPPVDCYDWVKKDAIEKAPIWCSVDLRDGNQALIEPMNLEEKVKFYQMLVDIGFKPIEVGFPAASEPEYQFLRTIIERNSLKLSVAADIPDRAFWYSWSIITAKAGTVTDNAMITEAIFFI